MGEVLITKFGRAKLDKYGYYRITSHREGNRGKSLHRLVWEDFYKKSVPEDYDIHHINLDKTDNHIQNLQCVEHILHMRFHKKGENNPMYGNKHSDDTLKNMSKVKNTSGYFRVSKNKDKRLKQGFEWRYTYYENGKQKSITSVSLEKLEKKVKDKNLKWEKL